MVRVREMAKRDRKPIFGFKEPERWPASFGATDSVELKGNRSGSIDKLIAKNKDPHAEAVPMDATAADHLKAQRLSINKYGTLWECHLHLFRTYFRTEWTEDLLCSIFFETVLTTQVTPSGGSMRQMNVYPFGVISNDAERDLEETAMTRALYMQEARRLKHDAQNPSTPFGEERGIGKACWKDVNLLRQAAKAEMHKARNAPWWELRPEKCGQLRTNGLRKLVHLHLSTLRELSARTEGDDAFVQVATAADEHELALQVAYMLEYRANARAAKLQSHHKRITASLHAMARKMRQDKRDCEVLWTGLFDKLLDNLVPKKIAETKEHIKAAEEAGQNPMADAADKAGYDARVAVLRTQLETLQGEDRDAKAAYLEKEVNFETKWLINAFRNDGSKDLEFADDILKLCQHYVDACDIFDKSKRAYKNLLQLGASIDDALSTSHLSLLGTQVKIFPKGCQVGSEAHKMPETLSEAMIRQRDLSNKYLFTRVKGRDPANNDGVLSMGLAARREAEKNNELKDQKQRETNRREGLKYIFGKRLDKNVHRESNETLFGARYGVVAVDLKTCKTKEDLDQSSWKTGLLEKMQRKPGHHEDYLQSAACYLSHFGRRVDKPDNVRETHETPVLHNGHRDSPKVTVPTFMDPPMLPMRVSAPPREGKTALSLLLASFAVKLGFTVLLGVAPNKKIPVSEMFEKLNKLHWDEPADTLSSTNGKDPMKPTFAFDSDANARSAGLVTAFISGNAHEPILNVRSKNKNPKQIKLSRDNHVEMAKALHSGNRANRVRLIVFSTMELADLEGVARILRFIEEEDLTGLAFKMYDEAQFLCKDETVVPLKKYSKLNAFEISGDGWSSKAVEVKQELDAVRSTYPLIYGLNCCITATHMATFFERPLYGSLLAESAPPLPKSVAVDKTLTESQKQNIEQKLFYRQAPLVVDATQSDRTYYPVLPPALQPRKIQVFDPFLEYVAPADVSGQLERITYVGSSAILGPIWSCEEYYDQLECNPTLRLDEGLIGKAKETVPKPRRRASGDDDEDEDDDDESDDDDDDDDDSDSDVTTGDTSQTNQYVIPVKDAEALKQQLVAIKGFADVKNPSWNLRLVTVQFIDFLIGRLHLTEPMTPEDDDLHLSDKFGNWFFEVNAGKGANGVNTTVVVPTHVMAVSKNVQADMGMLHQIRWMQIHGLFANFCRSARLLLQPRLYKENVIFNDTAGQMFWNRVRPPTDELLNLSNASVVAPDSHPAPAWAQRAAQRMLEPSYNLDAFVAENGFGFVVFASNAAIDATKIEKAGAVGGFVDFVGKGKELDQISSKLDNTCNVRFERSFDEFIENMTEEFTAAASHMESIRWPSRATHDFVFQYAINYPKQSVFADCGPDEREDQNMVKVDFRRLAAIWWKERWTRIAKVIADHTVSDADTKCVLFLSDPLLDVNNVHDPYPYFKGGKGDKGFNSDTRAACKRRTPGEGVKGGPKAGIDYLKEVEEKLKTKGRDIMNEILDMEELARALILETDFPGGTAHDELKMLATSGPAERYPALADRETQNAEFFDDLLGSMINNGPSGSDQTEDLKENQLPEPSFSAVMRLRELKGGSPDEQECLRLMQNTLDVKQARSEISSDDASKFRKAIDPNPKSVKQAFGAPLKKALEYSEFLYLVRTQRLAQLQPHDAVDVGMPMGATRLDYESRFNSGFKAAKCGGDGGAEWYSNISEAFPDFEDVLSELHGTAPIPSYERGRTWAFRCASADDALAIARAIGIFKVTMVGYDAMSAGLTIQSQVRSDNGGFLPFVNTKRQQREFLSESSDKSDPTAILAIELLEQWQTNGSGEDLLQNRSVVPVCVENCIHFVAANAPFLDVVDSYLAEAKDGEKPNMLFMRNKIDENLKNMCRYLEDNHRKETEENLALGTHKTSGKTRICYVPGSIALASSKNVALDDAYQMLGRTFVDMKTIPLPEHWKVSMLGAMCQPVIGRKPAKLWDKVSFDRFSTAGRYENPEAKFERVKQYFDRCSNQVAFLQILRQLALVEHALADEPSVTGIAAEKLTGMFSKPQNLASPLPGVGEVQVPMGPLEIKEEQHGMRNSHMATLLRMQSRGLYTGLAAAMLGNSREPVRGAEDVMVSSDRPTQPMADALRAAFAQATSTYSGGAAPVFDGLSADCKAMLTRRVGHRDHGTGSKAVTASWRVFYENLD